MTRTVFDHLVLDPDPYWEKYGELSSPLTEKQAEAITVIVEEFNSGREDVFDMTIPEFLEEEQLYDASRQWLRNLLYRYPAHWLTDRPNNLAGMSESDFDRVFRDGSKEYPWSEAGYVCEVDGCGFESHWKVDANRHQDANGKDEAGNWRHPVTNQDRERISGGSGSSSSSSGRRGKWQTATIKEMLLEHSKPYKERWGESPRVNEELKWPLKDVSALQEFGHDIGYDMTISEFKEALEEINEKRREEFDELNTGPENLIYDAFVDCGDKYIRKMLLRYGPGLVTRGYSSDLPEEFQDQDRTLQFVNGWVLVCKCGSTFSDGVGAKSHLEEERGDLELGDEGYWDHKLEVSEVES